MKWLSIFIILAIVAPNYAMAAGESATILKFANDKGYKNRIDWGKTDSVIVYAYESMYIGWTGRRSAGQWIRVQVLNNTQKRIRIRFPRAVEWESIYEAKYRMMPGEVRIYEFMAVVDSEVPYPIVRGRVIY